jgi:DNA phosphorothioation-dependent restriction protein DptG
MKTKKNSLVGKIIPPLHRDGKEQPTVKEPMENEMLAKYFVDLLKDIYWAEKHLVKELAKMAKNATSEALKQAFLDHRDETEGQIERLVQVFETVGKKATAKKCEAMEGLTKEAKEAMEETEDDSYTRDVALIVTAQKVEHYEIASYGSLAQIARTLGNIEAAELLEETLEEEKNADNVLTMIAESGINEQAAEEEEAAE